MSGKGPIRRDPPDPPLAVVEATRLACTLGGHDKQYLALLCRLDGGWAAIVAWGPCARQRLPWQVLARGVPAQAARQALAGRLATKAARGYAPAPCPTLPEGFARAAAGAGAGAGAVASIGPATAPPGHEPTVAHGPTPDPASDEASRRARAIEL